jgi:hypothetical protein
MDRGKKDSPQRTQRGAEMCCCSLRASAPSAVFRIVPVNNKKYQIQSHNLENMNRLTNININENI